MRTGSAPSSREGGLLVLDMAVRQLEDEWTRGEPNLRHLWSSQEGADSIEVLAALVKADLGCRYARGERPAVSDYLAQYPELQDHSEKVLSLVYEEYCLREERGERPDTEEFCERYAPWKDSLVSQLRYHRVLSQVVGPPTALPRFPKPGDLFATFRICGELGRGGAARVFLAREELLGNREVALKVSLDRGSEPSILGRLEHPNIVAVLSTGTDADSKLRFLCMPYRPGLPLDEVIRRIGRTHPSRPESARSLQEALAPTTPLTPPVESDLASATLAVGEDPAPGTCDESSAWVGFPDKGHYADGVAWVALTLARALHYAHGKKVYHRDVKPANILLTQRDGPQLLDFNLSHDPHSAEQAEAALRGGTLPYMAPEQLQAFLNPTLWNDVCGPSDIYSLGLVMFELLTGQAPENPDPTVPLPRAILGLLDRRRSFQPTVRSLNPGISHSLEAIVDRCLVFEPSERYANAGQLSEDLERYLARRPLKIAPNRSHRERGANWIRRNRLRLVACAILGAATLAYTQPWRPPVERREAFLAVVDAVDKGRHQDAQNGLLPFLGETRKSVILGIYWTITLANLKLLDEAEAMMEEVWSHSDAEQKIFAWSEDHPEIATHLERAGRSLLSSYLLDRSLKDEKRNESRIHRTEQALLLALRIKQGRVGSLEGLAVINERKEEYKLAHRYVSEAMKFNPSGASLEEDRRLRSFLHARARITCPWADNLLAQLIDGRDTRSIQEIRLLIQELFSDLKGADKISDTIRTAQDTSEEDRRNESGLSLDRNFIRYRAKLVQAKLYRFQHKEDDARTLFDEVLAYTRSAKDDRPGRQDAYKEMGDKAQEGISMSPRKLAVDP